MPLSFFLPCLLPTNPLPDSKRHAHFSTVVFFFLILMLLLEKLVWDIQNWDSRMSSGLGIGFPRDHSAVCFVGTQRDLQSVAPVFDVHSTGYAFDAVTKHAFDMTTLLLYAISHCAKPRQMPGEITNSFFPATTNDSLTALTSCKTFRERWG